jgi:anti-anti-sigma factor
MGVDTLTASYAKLVLEPDDVMELGLGAMARKFAQARRQQKDIVIDAARLRMLPSGSISILVQTHAELQAKGYELAMVNVHKDTRDELSVMGLDRVLKIYDTITAYERAKGIGQ